MHTPGPWTIRENENGTLGIDAKEPDGTYCQPARVNGDATDSVYGTTTWANARLIAAAPTMLKTLKDAAGALYRVTDDPNADKLYSDALAIAEDAQQNALQVIAEVESLI